VSEDWAETHQSCWLAPDWKAFRPLLRVLVPFRRRPVNKVVAIEAIAVYYMKLVRASNPGAMKEHMRRYSVSLFILPLVLAASAYADPILGVPLSSFAVLGGSTVTNVPTATIDGNVGVWSSGGANAITGFTSPTDSQVTGTVQKGGAPAQLAQSELTTAIDALEGLTAGSTPESELGGLTLGPGVYSSASTMDLTGTLTLDGYGNPNAFWVFLVGSSLTTASNSDVIVENAGAGAGVYWVMETASATLGSGSTFEGNILANASIMVGTTVTDSCGRALASVGAVTLAGTDTIGIGCSGNLAGSSGLSGGGTLDVQTGTITPLRASPVPEPGSFWFVALCLGGLAIQRKRLLMKAH